MNKQCPGDKTHWNEIRFLTETGARNLLQVLDLLSIYYVTCVDIIYLLYYSFNKGEMAYGMAYFKTEYSYGNEVPKGSNIFVSWTANIFN